MVKPRLSERNEVADLVEKTDESSAVARRVLAWVLDQTLRLMHPVMPFITEALWKKLNEAAPERGIDEVRRREDALITAAWPDAGAWQRQADVEREMEALQNVIRALRDIRTRVNTIRAREKKPSIRTLPHAAIRTSAQVADSLKKHTPVIQRLGQCSEFEIGLDITKPPGSFSSISAGVEVYVPVGDLADLGIERERLVAERDEVAGHIRRVEGKLSNEGFVNNAPAAVVARERARLADAQERLTALERNLREIGG